MSEKISILHLTQLKIQAYKQRQAYVNMVGLIKTLSPTLWQPSFQEEEFLLHPKREQVFGEHIPLCHIIKIKKENLI